MAGVWLLVALGVEGQSGSTLRRIQARPAPVSFGSEPGMRITPNNHHAEKNERLWDGNPLPLVNHIGGGE